MSKKIGFVGLGTTGLPMATNLNKTGFEAIGYDAFDGSRERARAVGITVVTTLKEAAEQADDAIVSAVRDYNQSVEILPGEDSLLSVDPKDLTIIVMSTLDPDSMNALGQQVKATVDVKLITTAVSGGATGAQADTLSVMASGPKDRVSVIRSYFDAVGSNTFYCSVNPDNSQAAKLVNNMVLGIIMNGVAKGLEFGKHCNLPREALLNPFKASTGDSWVTRNQDSVLKWTEGTVSTVPLKGLGTVHLRGLEHDITMPSNTLPSTMPLDSWGQKPRAK